MRMNTYSCQTHHLKLTLRPYGCSDQEPSQVGSCELCTQMFPTTAARPQRLVAPQLPSEWYDSITTTILVVQGSSRSPFRPSEASPLESLLLSCSSMGARPRRYPSISPPHHGLWDVTMKATFSGVAHIRRARSPTLCLDCSWAASGRTRYWRGCVAGANSRGNMRQRQLVLRKA